MKKYCYVCEKEIKNFYDDKNNGVECDCGHYTHEDCCQLEGRVNICDICYNKVEEEEERFWHGMRLGKL